MTWYQKYNENYDVTAPRYVGMIIQDDDDINWAGKAFALLMLGDSTGPTIIRAHGGDALGIEEVITPLLSSYLNDTWYEFELVLDFSNKTYDISVREAGLSTWEATASGYLQNPNTATSFDQIWCKASHAEIRGYWDDVKVISGTPTYECGDWGYSLADLNKDCYVDFEDLAYLDAHVLEFLLRLLHHQP